MKDILKKAVLLGVGAATLTRDKAMGIVKDLQKAGYLNAKEGQKMVKDLMKKSTETQKKVQAMVKEQVDKAVKAMPLATKKDLKDLEKKIKKK